MQIGPQIRNLAKDCEPTEAGIKNENPLIRAHHSFPAFRAERQLSTCRNNRRNMATESKDRLVAPASSQTPMFKNRGIQAIEKRWHILFDFRFVHFDDAIAPPRKPASLFRARVFRLRRFVSRHEIDHGAQRERNQIRNVRADRHLPFETEARETAVFHETFPKRTFGIGGISS
jgi:hypothetical protein